LVDLLKKGDPAALEGHFKALYASLPLWLRL
jgi:hypothetical protein